MYSEEIFTELESILGELNVSILGIKPGKERFIKLADGNISDTMLVKKIKEKASYMSKELNTLIYGKDLKDFITKYAEARELVPQTSESIQESRELMAGFTLAKDISFTVDKEPVFFLVNDADMISEVPAHHYISTMELEKPDRVALPLIREYAPRSPFGITKRKVLSGENLDHINSYIPPQWMAYEGDLPDELPRDIDLLFKQITDPMDRKFFFHWLYQSLTNRAGVYLILCGDPAVGKNRMKAVIRALHGHHNSVDGKKNTLVGNFNAQLANNTYVHFDELQYTVQDENIMKEIPNGTISIEQKFKDSTRATKIFCSIVISNNKARDNYIAFDARKFSPVTLSKERLETVIPKERISKFSDKIDFPDAKTYDLKYIAQIGRWVLKHGNREDLFPQGEYRGQRFWELAHSSMFAWQKAVVKVLTNMDQHSSAPAAHMMDLKEGKMLFSMVQNIATKSKKLKIKDSEFPGDYSSAMYFLTIFRGLDGSKIFDVAPTDDHIYGDFHIKLIKDIPAEDLL